jgi:hypothetical protein
MFSKLLNRAGLARRYYLDAKAHKHITPALVTECAMNPGSPQ